MACVSCVAQVSGVAGGFAWRHRFFSWASVPRDRDTISVATRDTQNQSLTCILKDRHITLTTSHIISLILPWSLDHSGIFNSMKNDFSKRWQFAPQPSAPNHLHCPSFLLIHCFVECFSCKKETNWHKFWYLQIKHYLLRMLNCILSSVTCQIDCNLRLLEILMWIPCSKFTFCVKIKQIVSQFSKLLVLSKPWFQ